MSACKSTHTSAGKRAASTPALPKTRKGGPKRTFKKQKRARGANNKKCVCAYNDGEITDAMIRATFIKAGQPRRGTLIQVPNPWGGKSDSPRAESHEKRRIAFLKHLPKKVQDMIKKTVLERGKDIDLRVSGYYFPPQVLALAKGDKKLRMDSVHVSPQLVQTLAKDGITWVGKEASQRSDGSYFAVPNYPRKRWWEDFQLARACIGRIADPSASVSSSARTGKRVQKEFLDATKHEDLVQQCMQLHKSLAEARAEIDVKSNIINTMRMKYVKLQNENCKIRKYIKSIKMR